MPDPIPVYSFVGAAMGGVTHVHPTPRHILVGHNVEVTKRDLPDARVCRVIDAAFEAQRDRWVLLVIDLETNDLDAVPCSWCRIVTTHIDKRTPVL